MFPNFIIVGAPKAGTTSLYHYLSEHPEVYMSEPKELNFFSKVEIEAQGLYYADFKVNSMDEYKRLFNGASNEKAIGEGSVSYLFYPETPRKIKEALPDVKIVILLRNPVERAFSHYLMDLKLGLVDMSFEDIVFKQSNDNHSALFYQQYVELGLYYEQVKRYLDSFGEDQVKIYLQEDLRYHGDDVILDLYKFLGIDASYKLDAKREHNTFSMPRNSMMSTLYASNIMRLLVRRVVPNKLKDMIEGVVFEKQQKPELASQTRKRLANIYDKNIEHLEGLISRNLSAWK